MPQKKEWEKEYKESVFVTLHNEPQKFFLRFLKFLKKNKFDFKDKKVLDLGCGTGRNSNYLAELGADVSGIDISSSAIKIARERAEEKKLKAGYVIGDIGSKYDFKDKSMDLVIDITASNSLSNEEREVYLKETERVLKSNGYFFVRALCKDGDKNAKKLLKSNQGKEKDTYVLPGVNIEERVFSKADFLSTYSKYFKIIKIKKESGYSKFGGRKFKRNFWIVYLKNTNYK
jgi:ubiquinone/menaquinone biosynthesis C-methylase UbiE